MKSYDDQITRIKNKLVEARKGDKNFKVFGADTHRYVIGPPVTIKVIDKFEDKYSVQLPDCYKAFLLNIGNSGRSYLGSAAGPF